MEIKRKSWQTEPVFSRQPGEGEEALPERKAQIENSWQHLDKEPSPSMVRENWERLKEKDRVAANIILEGLKLDFVKLPKLSWGCPSSVRTNSVQSLRLEEFLGPWLKAGIVAEGRWGDKGYFSRLFTVPM